jgi:enediyne biosynthesis protein E4
MGDAPSLLRNELSSSSHWIQFRLEGTRSNRSAIGATVRIEAAGRIQTKPCLSQSSYVSQNDLRLHFGLGSATRVDRITVRWPSGTAEEFSGVPADGFVLLVEGSGTGKRLSMPR